MFKSKKGIMGVGMLLIFIASIVSAAIAAALLISSTSLLQERAAQVQDDVTEGLITGFDVVSIYAQGDTNSSTLNDLEMILRLRAGSRPIDMGNVGLTLISGNVSFTVYLNESLSGDNCTFTSLVAEEEFCIDKIFGDATSIMEKGDMVVLKFKLEEANSLGTEVDFDVIFQLRTGAPLIMQMQTPDLMLSSRIRLR